MEIQFRTRALKLEYENHKEAERKYGADVARRYIQRINIMKQVRNLPELMRLPGLRCHPLKGERKGQYAISLDIRNRLIFTVSGSVLEIAHIEEVSRHYGD